MEVAHHPPKKVYKGEELEEAPERIRQSKGISKYFCLREDGTVAWLTDVNGDQMVDFLDRNKDKPFFMYWSPHAVHSIHDEVPPRLMNRTSAEGYRKKLGGGIVAVDDQVGKLLDVLEKHKLKERTLVIFSSDNGANPGEDGSSAPYRGGKGQGTQQIGWSLIPTVISWPGTIPQGKRYDGLSCTLDFFATIAAAIGKPAPKHLDGVDLVPYLRGDKEGDAHEYLYWLNNQPDDAVRRWLVAVRWKHWRLYKYKETDKWQLFDLVKDPREEKDVAGEYPEVVENMSRRHREWVKTLAPLEDVPDLPRVTPTVSEGHGWVISDGSLRPEIDMTKTNSR
jgi:arylsulfatase A-like enzyme